MLACPIAEAGSPPAGSWSSPEPWREVGEASDGRVPPVSDLASGWGARAAGARGPSAWAARMGRARGPNTAQCGFSFSFCLKMLGIGNYVEKCVLIQK